MAGADADADVTDETGVQAVETDADQLGRAEIRTTWLPVIGPFWKWLQIRRKRKRLAEKGYVEWYIIEDTFPRPRFIKPEANGGGMYEYEYDGETYLFPRDAMLPNSRQGVRTVVHTKGDAEPINLREPDQYALDADQLNEYLSSRLATSPPSLLDRLDLDPGTIMMGLVALIVIAAILMRVM